MSNTLDKKYQNLLSEILNDGVDVPDRTGTGCRTIPSASITHDMSEGFPLLTLRHIPYRSVRVELEGFIKGINNKRWYEERKTNYWSYWCNPRKVPYSNDPETKQKMKDEPDLGWFYAKQYRQFCDPSFQESIDRGYDQLDFLVDEIRNDPNSRRMLVSAWNPLALGHTALPSCHDSYVVTILKNKLSLTFRMRSVDTILGLPSNLASYGTLLHLLAKTNGYEEGTLTAQLSNVHIYNNHIPGAIQLLLRDGHDLPSIQTDHIENIFDWDYTKTKLLDYKHEPKIKFEVAV